MTEKKNYLQTMYNDRVAGVSLVTPLSNHALIITLLTFVSDIMRRVLGEHSVFFVVYSDKSCYFSSAIVYDNFQQILQFQSSGSLQPLTWV